MSPNLVRTYYHGKYAWQNHALDIAEACEANAGLQRQSLRLQTKTMEAAQEQHEELHRQGEAQREELMGIRGDLQEMTEEIRCGMSLVVDRLDTQIQIFSEAVNKLDEINKTLKIPRATEANELFGQGEQWFEQGLFEESLDAYLKAEQIYKVHYLLQFRIGSLFLEGTNRKSNVIDISRAEPHLLLATRYAEVQDETDSTARRVCGDAYFRAGKAAYLLAEERKEVGDIEGVQSCLQRALQHLAKSVQLWPENTATVYWQAKCHALLGQKPEALDKFRILSDRNRKYCADAIQDGDFEALQDDLKGIFRRALESPGPQARTAHARLDKALEALAWARRSNPESNRDVARVSEIDRELSEAQRQLPGLDVDIENLLLRLLFLLGELADITERTLRTKIASRQQQVSSLYSHKAAIENQIASCKQQMAQTQGSGGIGCLSVFVFFIAFQGFVTGLPAPWRAALVAHTSGLASFVIFVGWLVLGYSAGIWISRTVRNDRTQTSLDGAKTALDVWNRTAPSVIHLAETDLRDLTKQLDDFTAWRKTSQVPVLKS